MGQETDRLDAMRCRNPHPTVGPEHVVIDLTNRCNNNCIACWTRSPLLRDRGPNRSWFGEELPARIVCRSLEELGEMGCKVVRFTGGGEPTLHPDFDSVLCAASSAGLRVAVTTNGTRLHQMSDNVLGMIDELTVSLWAATPSTYARLHPNKTGKTFERIIQKLREITSAGSQQRHRELVIANVVGTMNHHELEQMVELAVHVGASRVYFAVVDPVPGCTDGLLLDAGASDDLARRARACFAKSRHDISIDNEEGFVRRVEGDHSGIGRYDRQAVDEVPCLVGWGFARILANGDVVPCCRAVNRPMGNINRTQFRAIWNSARYEDFRRHADTPKSDTFFTGIGCDLTCDNLMHNQEWHRLLGGGELQPSGGDSI